MVLSLLFSCTIVHGQDTTVSNNAPQALANRYLGQARSAYLKGDYETYRVFSDSLYTYAAANKLPKMQVLGLVNLAVYYNNRGESQKAIAQYLKGLRICETIPKDLRTKLVVMVNLGNTYHNIDAYDKSIHTMEEVLTTYEALGDSTGYRVKTAATYSISMNYLELGKYEEAAVFAERTKALAERYEDKELLASALGALGEVYFEKREYQKTVDIVMERLRMPQLRDSTKQQASALLLMGKSFYELGENEEALSYLEKVRGLAKIKGLKTVLSDGEKYSALAYEKLGDLKSSLRAQKAYTELNKELNRNNSEAVTLDMEKDLNLKEKEVAEIGSWFKKTLSLSIVVGILLLFSLVVVRKRKLQLNRAHENLQEEHSKLLQNIAEMEKKPQREAFETKISSAYKNSSLTSEDYERYKVHITAYMKEHKPFLDQNLSQATLATLLEISAHHLSEVLRFGFDQNFYNFINSYRVMEAQRLMENDTKNKEKILAIGFDSGFKSKTSFNRVFKSHTGMTPTEYRKQQSL